VLLKRLFLQSTTAHSLEEKRGKGKKEGEGGVRAEADPGRAQYMAAEIAHDGGGREKKRRGRNFRPGYKNRPSGMTPNRNASLEEQERGKGKGTSFRRTVTGRSPLQFPDPFQEGKEKKKKKERGKSARPVQSGSKLSSRHDLEGKRKREKKRKRATSPAISGGAGTEQRRKEKGKEAVMVRTVRC